MNADNPIAKILSDAISPAPLLWNSEVKPEPLTAESLRAAIKKLNEQYFWPPPCGTEERPHLIHPRDWAEGNPWLCANMCGQIVDPKEMAGWDGPYEYPADHSDGEDSADQQR